MTQRHRIEPPPSSVTGPLGNWLTQIAQSVNDTPMMSYFSGTSPNSTLTGQVGNLAINVASGSSGVRAWLKGGDPLSGPSTTGWIPLAASGSSGTGEALTAVNDSAMAMSVVWISFIIRASSKK